MKKKHSLKKFYKSVLKEDTKRLSVDSIDDQIDSLLLGYKGNASVKEGRSLHSLMPLLMEAPEDEEELEDPAAGEEEEAELDAEAKPEEVQGSESIDAEAGAEPMAPKIDLDMYAQRVVNLLDNHDTVLDIRPVIINRAMNVLREEYGEDVIEEFENILDSEFGIALGRTAEEVPERPLGGNAGPSPA